MFKVQRNLLASFHVTNAGEYFSGQDFWQVPNTPDAPQEGVKQPPFYLNVQLPGQDSTRFQLTSAVTPRNRDNLAALISGSYVDGQPKLEVLELPDQTAIPGPVQVHQRMSNNADVRSQLTLLSTSTQSTVLYGNLISLPVGDGMLYVEPIYVKGTQANATPLLQKVLMSFGDGSQYVTLANNLEQGLADLIKQGQAGAGTGSNPPANTENPPTTGTNPPGQTGPVAQAAAELNTAINNAREAQKSGDFARYGQALEQLDDAMTKYQAAVRAAGGAVTAPSTPPSTNPSASPPAPNPSPSG
jgi:uncharacterized membrane protein (UPF0182 family)